MRCIVCGQPVPIGSPTLDLCSTACIQAHQRAQETAAPSEDVQRLLRERGRHAAYCARRYTVGASCTCSLRRHAPKG